ncbi:MAG: vWA domain-containing protein [Roseovarius sp.]
MKVFTVCASVVLGAGNAIAEEAASHVDPDAAAVFAQYIETEGQDFEACFRALPDMLGAPGPASFEDATPSAPQAHRLVVAVDASGSMAGTFGGRTKMDAARAATLGFLGSTPREVEVALVAFGHRGTNEESGREESCAGVETLASLSTGRDAVRAGIEDLTPNGWTPLASAIEAAAAELRPSEEGEQVVYIVSDGEETCGGDPVAAARALREGALRAVVNIVGFDLADEDRAQLMAVAEAGDGTFAEADPDTALDAELERLLAQAANANEITRARAGAANAGTSNRADIANHLTTLRACVANAGVTERAGLSEFLTRGAVERGARRDVEDLLKERHATFQTRVADIEGRADALLNAAQDEIDAARDKAQQGYDETLKGE